MPTKKPVRKPKKGAWFVQVRGSYLPCSWQGWLSYVPLALLGLFPIKYTYDTLQMCKAGWTDPCYNYSSAFWGLVLDTFIAFVVYYSVLYGLMLLLAKRKS